MLFVNAIGQILVLNIRKSLASSLQNQGKALGLVRATITQEKPEARKALAASSCLLSFACCAIRAAEHSRLKAIAAIVAFF